MIVDPKVFPVTNPELLILATKGFNEIQGVVVAGDPFPVSWEVEPKHTNRVPEIIGNGFTVTVAVIKQPLVLV